MVFLVLCHAPATVQETEVEPNGATASVILIGDRRFRKTGSSWIELPPSAGVGARAVATITAPVRGAVDADHVTRQGDRYSFVPRNLDKLLTTVLDVDPSRLSAPHLDARGARGHPGPGDDHRRGHQPTSRGGPGLLPYRLGGGGDRPPVRGRGDTPGERPDPALRARPRRREPRRAPPGEPRTEGPSARAGLSDLGTGG